MKPILQTEMTPKERVIAAIKNQSFDVTPAITPTSVANYECMRIAGVSFPDAHTDAQKMAALASTAYTVLGFDSIIPYFSVHLEAEMLGCQVQWNESRGMPFITRRALSHIEDYKPPKNFLSKNLCQQLLHAIRILHKKYGDEVAVIGKVLGPWSLAYNLYGVENLILDTILQPEKLKGFIWQLLDISISFAQAQFDAGADIVTWADHVTSDLVSAKLYEEFVFPLHRQATAKLSGDKYLILHTCGNVIDRLPLIRDAGFKMFHIDSRNNLSEAVKIADNKLMLAGSINNPVTLLEGNHRDIINEVDANVQSGIRFIAPECAIPFQVSNKNLISLVSAAHSHSHT